MLQQKDADIKSLQQEVTTLKENVATLTAEVSTLRTKLNTLSGQQPVEASFSAGFLEIKESEYRTKFLTG